MSIAQHQNQGQGGNVFIPSPEHALARDPNRAMQQMMDTIDRLRGSLEQETDALLKADTNGFLALQQEKLERAMAYESAVRQVVARKKDMEAVDPALKLRLNEMQDSFFELSKRNMDALKRMQRTVERLGNTLRKAARDEAKKQSVFSYGGNGRIEDNNRRISISIQEEA